MLHAQFAFKIAAGLYGMSLAAAFVSKRPAMLRLFLLPAIAANATAVALRYWIAWPMLPMYLGPPALPLFLGAAALFDRQNRDDMMVQRLVLVAIVILSAAAGCFPKDFYLPFLKSETLWSHIFFLFGVAGKGCFLIGAVRAIAGLIRGGGDSSPFSWTVWGFAFWTLSMFAGEIWSYLGWGTPVVWDDPAITTTMGTWFYYVCLLHLHLTGTWSPQARDAYAALGALVVLGLNITPDLGPFRWLF